MFPPINRLAMLSRNPMITPYIMNQDDTDEGDATDEQNNPSTPLQSLAPGGNVNGVNTTGVDTSKLGSLAMKTPMQDTYFKSLQSPPDPNNFKPGIINRLAALGTGMSIGLRGGNGATAAQGVLNAPYDRAVALYGMRNKQLGEAATEEEKNITNQRLAENESIKNIIAAGNANSEATLRSAQQAYYGARTLALAHPDWKIAKAGGQVIMVDPKNPTNRVSLGDANLISPQALAQQISKFRDESKIKEGAAEQLEGVRQNNRATNIKARGEVQKDVNANKPTNNLSPSQYRIAKSQAIQDVLSDPANAGMFKNIVNQPTKDNPYYTVKGIEEGNLDAHSKLLEKVNNRLRQITNGKTPGDVNLPKDNEQDDDNNDDDFEIEELDKK